MAVTIQASDWLSFLENRLAQLARQLEFVIGFAGVIPLGGVVSASATILSDPRIGVGIAGAVSVAFILVAFYFASLVVRRRRIIVLMQLILSGFLRTPQGIGLAYSTLVR